MNKTESSPGANIKQKAAHELMEFIALFVYLAFFLCSLDTYRFLLLRELHVQGSVLSTYAVPLINALVVAKVIMIGEYAKVGTRYHSRSLLQSTMWKAFLFTLLLFAFHFVEELIKYLLHGGTIAGVSHEIRVADMVGRTLVVFCTFVSLFGFREFRRVLGEKRFLAIVFSSEEAGKSDLPASSEVAK